ncbi:MAG TPA: flavodoxin family protein [Acidimicrobiales bacterium]
MTRAVVIYESRTGNTAKVAGLIADAVRDAGGEASVFPVHDIGLKELAEADVVFLGTWVDGLILLGHRPGGKGKLRKLPVIDGKRAAIFMSYAIHAGKALDRFASVVEERGGTVVARQLFRRDQPHVGVEDFVHNALAAVPAANS